MAWGIPEYKPEQYNRAGRALVSGDSSIIDQETALYMINNWRSSHYHPLNTFQLRLRRKAQEVDSNSLVAQRIKRLYSIKHKLERFPEMKLTQIQDIGGCRAIVSTNSHLDKLVSIMALRDKERAGRGLKHKLVSEKDYVKNPKASGYRGVHLVFRYKSDKLAEYNDLKIEIQLRTTQQHAWATAVETASIFTGEALKSSIGAPDWLRFFALASSAMAASEGMTIIPGTPTSQDEVRKELRELTYKLDVHHYMRSYSRVMKHVSHIEKKDAQLFLLQLNAEEKTISIDSFKSGEFEKASSRYLSIEKEVRDKNVDAVLVSADSMATLRRAYPNYFVDTEIFLDALTRVTA